MDHRERVDGVELDVFVSQDGEAVIHHDPVTKEGGLEMASHSAGELWEKTSVPTLRQVLRLCLQGGLKMVVVELKGENTPHPVAAVFSELLEEFGTERVFSSLRISGFLHDVIDAFGAIEAFSAIPRAYTASVCSDELIDRAVQHGITDLHLHQRNVDADLVNKIHQHKLKLMTYSSGTIQESGMKKNRFVFSSSVFPPAHYGFFSFVQRGNFESCQIITT